MYSRLIWPTSWTRLPLSSINVQIDGMAGLIRQMAISMSSRGSYPNLSRIVMTLSVMKACKSREPRWQMRVWSQRSRSFLKFVAPTSSTYTSARIRWCSDSALWHARTLLSVYISAGRFRVRSDQTARLMLVTFLQTFRSRRESSNWQKCTTCRSSLRKLFTTWWVWRLVIRSVRSMSSQWTLSSIQCYRMFKKQWASTLSICLSIIRKQVRYPRNMRLATLLSCKSMRRLTLRISRTRVSITCSHSTVISWVYNSTSWSSTPSSAKPSRATSLVTGTRHMSMLTAASSFGRTMAQPSPYRNTWVFISTRHQTTGLPNTVSSIKSPTLNRSTSVLTT